MFNTYIYQPLFNFLVYIYQHLSFHDFGIAIIVFTVFIRIILYPLFYKGAKDQSIFQQLAPKLKEIQNKYKDDKEKQVQETMALYKEYKVNPFSPFFLIIIQLPILIALFKVFSNGISKIPELNPLFLGVVNITNPNFIIVALAALAQYYQSKISLPKINKSYKNLSPMEKMNRQMIFLGPIITIAVLFRLPSALALYWLTTTVFSIIQQIIINKHLKLSEIKKEAEKKNKQ
ncbi:MAG: YidC/Oxa1 family membrane protein insertase [Patescibacteria group bacterium]|nr:YidC/Oxa1 family membrane protein insertase [Patescibacteria group bacterium]